MSYIQLVSSPSWSKVSNQPTPIHIPVQYTPVLFVKRKDHYFALNLTSKTDLVAQKKGNAKYHNRKGKIRVFGTFFFSIIFFINTTTPLSRPSLFFCIWFFTPSL